jgi:hypothetical protein
MGETHLTHKSIVWTRRCVSKYQSNSTHIYGLLPPWSGVLEKLTGVQLVKKFPAFYGTRRFITAFTSTRQLNPVHTPTSYLQKIHLNIILPSTPGSPQWSLSLRSPHQNPVHALPFRHTRYIPRPYHSSRLYHPHNSG